MITGFSLYPGEVLLGAITRYGEEHAMSSAYILMEHLFGVAHLHPAVDLPSMLEPFAAMLPPGHAITAETLLMQHTAYPYVTAFSTAERAAVLREAMMSNNGRGIHRRAGLTSSKRSLPRRLRFCPMCAVADQQTYGQCYWHLLHQLPSVLVCPDHEVWLEDSELLAHARTSGPALIPAHEGMATVPTRLLDQNQPLHALPLALAHDVAWLLAHPVPADIKAVRDRYRTVLVERGLARYRGRVAYERVCELILSAYPPAILIQLGVPLHQDNQLRWLHRLFAASGQMLHPTYHLVLLHLLGMRAETFFTEATPSAFFGEGPWPCLNPVCPDFRRAVIPTCHIEFRPGSGGRPLGTFACHCGYIYLRTGLDRTAADRWRKTAIEAYGAVWEDTLRRAWGDSTLSVNKIAAHFHTRPRIITANAARLGLPFDRAYHTLSPFIRKTPNGPKGGLQPDEARIAHYQRHWLLTIEAQPELTMRQLAKILPNAYPMLLRNCRAWLAEHTPRSLRLTRESRRQDMWKHIWRARDRSLARQVRAVTKTMRAEWETPVRITAITVMRRLGKKAFFWAYKDKLPRTARVLGRVVESFQAFIIRRLRLAAAHQLHAEPSFTRTQLLQAAQVRRSIDDPIVVLVIDELCARNRRSAGQ